MHSCARKEVRSGGSKRFKEIRKVRSKPSARSVRSSIRSTIFQIQLPVLSRSRPPRPTKSAATWRNPRKEPLRSLKTLRPWPKPPRVRRKVLKTVSGPPANWLEWPPNCNRLSANSMLVRNRNPGIRNPLRPVGRDWSGFQQSSRKREASVRIVESHELPNGRCGFGQRTSAPRANAVNKKTTTGSANLAN